VPDFPAWTVGAVIGESQAVGEDIAEALIDARLLDISDVGRRRRPRHRFHDLVRLYARELACEEDTLEDRRDALDRVFGTWVALAQAAASRLPVALRSTTGISPGMVPGLLHGGVLGILDGSPNEIPDSPLAWFESECRALAALANQASTSGRPRAASVLSKVINTFQEARTLASGGDRRTAPPRQRNGQVPARSAAVG
jgi:hypothetical protein